MSRLSGPSLTGSLRELWSYRELFYFMVWRDIKVRYKQSVLGGLWAIIQPFGTMLVFTLFFNKLAGIESGSDVPYPIFSYSALLPWTYFSTTINQMGNSLVNNQHLITKVYFPRVTMPAAGAIRGLVDFMIAAFILLGLMAWYQFTPSWTFALWILLIVPLMMVTLGIGMLFGALNVKYRDVQHVLPFLVQMWLFITPVIWPHWPESSRRSGPVLFRVINWIRACWLSRWFQPCSSSPSAHCISVTPPGASRT